MVDNIIQIFKIRLSAGVDCAFCSVDFGVCGKRRFGYAQRPRVLFVRLDLALSGRVSGSAKSKTVIAMHAVAERSRSAA